MRTIKKITREEYVTDQVFCNKCGENCGLPKVAPGQESGHPHGLIETTVRGGYWSNPLQDCVSYTFSLCESCLSELFKTFKIPVGMFDYLDSIDYPRAP